ncbi:MAG TPA: HAMP domain-containing sensor histidine kinase [Acidimicrobiales bacterium]|nr:HAMP domain-containing sensor histidine kinase [Acidimicrobiales bacterium]
MTFRARLVLAATTAVVIAVVLAAVSAYVVSNNSLIGSLDDTLTQQAGAVANSNTPITNGCTATSGQCVQVISPDGDTGGPVVVPVTPSVRAVASGNRPGYFSDVTVRGIDARQIVYPLQNGALQITAPLTGVNKELRSLALDLWVIAAVGVTLAVLLGLLVGRTALVPLNSLTKAVEELAETTDVSQRLDAGGPDELGRLRRAFNRLLAALDSSRDAQRQLVLDASHELRTPLTSLKTNMEVARRLNELAPEEREVLIGDVLTQLDELTSLVGDLSELARGEVPALTSGIVSLDSVVADAVSVATTHGRSRNVTFAATIEQSLVAGSQNRLERAIGNLLDNALKWSPDGGVVEVSCVGGTVVVRDHGPGVSDDDLVHIFDRFYRAPAARGRPGSGLGLAIVAQVAREEGGSVIAGHAPGGGAIFRFSLPELEVTDVPVDAD